MADVPHIPADPVAGNLSAPATSGMHRRLAAILCADIVGYSRLVGRDEAGTFQRVKTLRAEVLEPSVAAHGGRIVSYAGDGALAEFPSVVRAVECALAVQNIAAEREPDIQAAQTAWGCSDPVNYAGGDSKSFSMPMDDFRWAFELNLFSLFRLSQLTAPHMVAAGHGATLNFSSKAAVSHLTRNIAFHVGPHGTQVNAFARRDPHGSAGERADA